MLEFVTREVQHSIGTIEAACLVSKPDDAGEFDGGIVKDNVLIPLPGQLVTAIAESAAQCETMERSGYGVDCGVFGALVLGGTYKPVSQETYQRGLHRYIEFGRWWEKDEILGVTATTELAQFCSWNGRLLPRHMAIKLPQTEGEYVQKIGHGLPIAISDAVANFRFHRANTVASTNKFTATYKDRVILSYAPSNPDTKSAGTYEGLPG